MKSDELRSRIPVMLVSLIASIMLFLHVQQQSAPKNEPLRLRVRVQVDNIPPGLVVVNQPSQVTWNVVGPPDALDVIDQEQDKLVTVVDLSGALPGARGYPVRISGPTFRNVTWSPVVPVARVELQRVVQRLIRVTTDTTGLPQDPNLVYTGDSVIEPDRVTVEGPEGLVNEITAVRATIDLSNVTANNRAMSFMRDLEAFRRDAPLGRAVTIDPPRVTVRPVFAVVPEQKPLLVNPQLRGQPAFGFRVDRIEVTPNQMTVRGPSRLLSRLAVTTTEPVDISGLRETRTFRVRVLPGDGARVAGNPFVSVRIVIATDPNATPPPVAPPTTSSPLPLGGTG